MKLQHSFVLALVFALTLSGASVPFQDRVGSVPIVSAAPHGSVLYAASTQQGSGNCSNWANACTLQTALTNAVSSDEIWVQAGVHKPGVNRTATFTLKNGVAIYGGFAGTESDRSQRNWQTNQTILSGDIDNNDINTDGNNIAETSSDIVGNNAYHVVTGGGTNNTAVLDGFVITAGQANAFSFPNNYGGGMYNNNSSPTLTNLIFSGNTAEYNGGGISNYGSSSPTLTDVTFRGNTAGFSGGGMYNNYNTTLTNVTFNGNSAGDGGGLYNASGTPILTNVTFRSNTASNGGGMYNDYSNLLLTNAIFDENSARFFGGGMFNYHSSPTLTNVTFNANKANDGGGMFNNDDDSNPIITRATFSQNIANHSGGGMYQAGGSPQVTNAVFIGNQASDAGGGMYNNGGSPTLINSSFYGNSANNRAGGIRNYGNANPTLTNVILWGNLGPEGQIVNDATSTPVIAYSDIQGCGGSGSWNSACGSDNGGNIDTDPLFVNAAGGNLRLQLTSPAIDAGKNSAVPVGITTDLDGNPRFMNIPTVPDTGNGTPPIVDMGAYEYQISNLDYKIYLPMIIK